MTKKKRGMKILNGCLAFSIIALIVITGIWFYQSTYLENKYANKSEAVNTDTPVVDLKAVGTKFASFCQVLLIRLLANSKCEDVTNAHNE
jgi:hypothetical protein